MTFPFINFIIISFIINTNFIIANTITIYVVFFSFCYKLNIFYNF